MFNKCAKMDVPAENNVKTDKIQMVGLRRHVVGPSASVKNLSIVATDSAFGEKYRGFFDGKPRLIFCCHSYRSQQAGFKQRPRLYSVCRLR